MKKVNVGIIGFGTVGSGVVKILRERKAYLAERIGLEIAVKRVCDKDILSRRNVSIDKSILTTDAREIIDNPQIDVVVELMGGLHPAKDFIGEALNKGKHVVTANKALLAAHGQELFTLADEKGKSVYFEASVGGGIPIIKALREGLVANRFSGIFGILNGTSNYILSKMTHDACSFAVALKEAQAKGFAEKDPTLDIEGLDSAHKLVILTYLAFGRFVRLSDVFVEGISHISTADINYAKDLGLQIKLLAIAKKEGDSLEVRVHPTLVPQTHLLASVNGVFNAIYAASDYAGDLLFYGPGAGQMSAASAVVSDIVDMTQAIKAGMFRATLRTVVDTSIKRVRNPEEFESKYYIRFVTADKPGVLAKIAAILAKSGISIASVTQKESRRSTAVPIVIIIHGAKEKNLRAALHQIERLDVVKDKPVAIRIEEV